MAGQRMERPAILNRSMPSPAGATIRHRASPLAVYGASPSINQSRDKERHYHVLEEVYQMGGRFSSVLLVDSYVSRQFPMFRRNIGRTPLRYCWRIANN